MKIIAHRGASAYAPENTLDAFRLALDMGAVNFEFDLHRTKDGVLVVNHNYYVVNRQEKKLPIAGLTFEELRKIDVACFFIGADFHCVPSFEEVLDTLGEKAELINVEIKNDGNVYPGIERQTLEIIRKRNLLNRILVSSFDFDTLKRMRDLAPNMDIGLLVHGVQSIMPGRIIRKAEEIKAVNLHIHIKTATAKNIALIREAGLHCYVYTVNSRKYAERLKADGADAVFSNYPDIMGEWKLKP